MTTPSIHLERYFTITSYKCHAVTVQKLLLGKDKAQLYYLTTSVCTLTAVETLFRRVLNTNRDLEVRSNLELQLA